MTYHGWYGSKKPIAKVTGKGKFRPPRGSENPERIWMKPRINNKVAGVAAHAKPRVDATTWVVSANT